MARSEDDPGFNQHAGLAAGSAAMAEPESGSNAVRLDVGQLVPEEKDALLVSGRDRE